MSRFIKHKQESYCKLYSAEIESSQRQKLLRITIDNQLSFEKHINNICGKIKANICALSQIAPFKDIKKKTSLRNAFSKS